MEDRDLLELAAKAAGIEVWPGIGFQAHMLFTRPAKADPDGKVTGVEWNPLTDDGDALRLAVKLHIQIGILSNPEVWAQFYRADDKVTGWITIKEPTRGDPCAATRRAIVRAAAAIGKEM